MPRCHGKLKQEETADGGARREEAETGAGRLSGGRGQLNMGGVPTLAEAAGLKWRSHCLKTYKVKRTWLCEKLGLRKRKETVSSLCS